MGLQVRSVLEDIRTAVAQVYQVLQKFTGALEEPVALINGPQQHKVPGLQMVGVVPARQFGRGENLPEFLGALDISLFGPCEQLVFTGHTQRGFIFALLLVENPLLGQLDNSLGDTLHKRPHETGLSSVETRGVDEEP